MRNGLSTSVPHIPLHGLLLPENIFYIQLASSSKPSIQTAFTLYLSYYFFFFHYLNQTFLIN